MPSPPQRLSTSRDVENHRVAILELGRPPVNAFDDRFKHELIAAAERLVQASDVRAVVIYGGERFSAGDDIKEMHAGDSPMGERSLELISEVCTTLSALPMPVVAAVRGFALGGGCEVALACDFRITSPDARWGLPEVHLGLIPGGGGTQRLARLIGSSRAKRMIFLGNMLTGTEAVATGLADEVVPDDQVLPHSIALARELADRAPLALRAAKQTIDRGLEVSLTEGLALESQAAIDLFGTEDAREGLASFLRDGPGRAEFRGI